MSFMTKTFISFGLLFFWCFSNAACAPSDSASTDPEVYMNVTEIIKYYGYPLEEHQVTTKDGYILSLQRIPHGVKNKHRRKRGRRQVVLLQHGLFHSAFTWVLNRPDKSIGFLLADDGFDVWLANSRGSVYSRGHTDYPTNSPKYWDFTWDEMATYDLPAVIDYVICVTRAHKLAYIAQSQGTEIGFAQFSKQTHLKSKVSAFVALAPVAYIGNMEVPMRSLAPLGEMLYKALQKLAAGEYIISPQLLSLLPKPPSGSSGSGDTSNPLQGPYTGNINQSRMAILDAHFPAGTSAKNVYHYSQSYLANKFQYFDYGASGNQKIYGQSTAPLYRLNTDGLPIAIFYGGSDIMVVPKDAERTITELGDNVKFKKFIPSYSHVDFIWSMDVQEQVVPDMIKFLKKHKC